MTTWVVTGMPRTGTSMMMRALSEGGLEPFVDEEKEATIQRGWIPLSRGGYNPNPHGVYEPGRFRRQADFPEMVQGKLVKLMGRNAVNRRFARIAPLRVVQMQRDPEAIAASHERTFGNVPPWAEPRAYERLTTNHLMRLATWPHIESVTPIKYEDVMDPETRLSRFERLVLDGWPIDAEVAAATVEESLSRHG
jgi:hypothetical protein